MTHAMTALDTAAGEELSRRRQKDRNQLTTGISLTVVPTLLARAFFEIADLPVDRHGGDVVRGLCGVTALLAMIVGGVLAVRAAGDLLRTRQMRKILQATSWIEYPARPVESRKRSVEVRLADVYTDLEVVGSAKRLVAQVRRSRRIELARLTPAGMQLVARAAGSSDLFLAEDDHASPESTEGKFGDFVVALTLRGSRRLVAHRSRSVARVWGYTLTFVALITIAIAIAIAAVSPDPVEAVQAPETWARNRDTYDDLKIIGLITAFVAVLPLMGLARATYRTSRGARRDRAVRAWIRKLLGWWAAILTTTSLLALWEPRRRVVGPAPVLVIATAAFALVLAVLAHRGPEKANPADTGASRPSSGKKGACPVSR